MSDADKLRRIAAIVERDWSAGGYSAGMSLDGVPGSPCVEDAAQAVGYPIGKLRRAGMGYKWNDRQRSGAAVGRALRRAAEREEVVAQKPEKVARQQPGAAPAASSGSRLDARSVAAAIALLVVIALVVRYAHVLLLVAEGVGALLLVSAAAWCGHAACEALNWDYIAVWRAHRAAERTAIEVRRAEVLARVEQANQPIALGPVAPITTDEVLKADWTQPHAEKELMQP